METHVDGVECAKGRDVGNRQLVVEQVDNGLDLLVKILIGEEQDIELINIGDSGGRDVNPRGQRDSANLEILVLAGGHSVDPSVDRGGVLGRRRQRLASVGDESGNG